MKKIIVAIDGPSSCGKSTLAKSLAKELGYGFIDSGAMYRVVTLYFLRTHIDISNAKEVDQALDQIQITFKNIQGKNIAFLNGDNVETDIRTMEVSDNVSDVAAISTIRKFIIRQQLEMGKYKEIVMDGRDIGTVVFPDAELKLFISASLETRSKRRFEELVARGFDITIDQVRDNLQKRDHIDSTRADSPLVKAKDAIGLDTTHLSPKRVLSIALRLTKNVLEN